MTVSSENSRIQYTANGAGKTFPFPFPLISSADLKVYKAGVLQTIITHYNLSLTLPQQGGVDIVFVTAPLIDEAIVMFRDPAITQAFDLVALAAYPTDNGEQAYDRLTMIMQRLNERLERTFHLADSLVTGANAELKPATANRLIGWDANATTLQNFTSIDTTATITAFVMTVLDDLNAAAVIATLGCVASAGRALFVEEQTINGGTPIVLEGATEDGFETSLVVIDPTDGRSLNIGDNDANLIYSRQASESVAGMFEKATQAEAEAATDTTRMLTVLRGVQGLKAALNVTGSAPMFACRAWCSWNGTGTVAIDADGNVSSITDNGTGDTTVTFTTAIEDISYLVSTGLKTHATGGHQAGSNNFLTLYNGATKLVGSVRVNTNHGNISSGIDCVGNYVAIFR